MLLRNHIENGHIKLGSNFLVIGSKNCDSGALKLYWVM